MASSKGIKIAIFASGEGTNAERIILYFREHSNISVETVFYNRKAAGVQNRAKKLGVESVYLPNSILNNNPQGTLKELKDRNIDYIILSGFLALVPEYLIEAFPNAIINIHPALLPKFGGKGMYGNNVHQAVKDAGEEESGISIHLVNQDYDKGELLFQAKCKISASDSVEDIANKVHALEYEHFSRVIENFCLGKF